MRGAGRVCGVLAVLAMLCLMLMLPAVRSAGKHRHPGNRAHRRAVARPCADSVSRYRTGSADGGIPGGVGVLSGMAERGFFP